MTNRFFGLGDVACVHRAFFKVLCIGGVLLYLCACVSPPPRPFAIDAAPMDQIPASLIGVTDDRARFREIYCEVLEARKFEQPNYRSCDVALTRAADEKLGLGQVVPLGQSRQGLTVFFVPGVGWDCFSDWLAPAATAVNHIKGLGYDFELVSVVIVFRRAESVS